MQIQINNIHTICIRPWVNYSLTLPQSPLPASLISPACPTPHLCPWAQKACSASGLMSYSFLFLECPTPDNHVTCFNFSSWFLQMSFQWGLSWPFYGKFQNFKSCLDTFYSPLCYLSFNISFYLLYLYLGANTLIWYSWLLSVSTTMTESSRSQGLLSALPTFVSLVPRTVSGI